MSKSRLKHWTDASLPIDVPSHTLAHDAAVAAARVAVAHVRVVVASIAAMFDAVVVEGIVLDGRLLVVADVADGMGVVVGLTEEDGSGSESEQLHLNSSLEATLV